MTPSGHPMRLSWPPRAGIAVLSNWSLVNSSFRLLATFAGILLSITGFGLCIILAGQIRDFKNLNNAKFKVLNDMAPAVQFGANDTRVSATPFAKEWEILKAGNDAQKVRFMKIIALRSSNVELYIPLAFCSLFCLIAVVAIGSAFLNWTVPHGSAVDVKQTIAPPTPQGKP